MACLYEKTQNIWCTQTNTAKPPGASKIYGLFDTFFLIMFDLLICVEKKEKTIRNNYDTSRTVVPTPQSSTEHE